VFEELHTMNFLILQNLQNLSKKIVTFIILILRASFVAGFIDLEKEYYRVPREKFRGVLR